MPRMVMCRKYKKEMEGLERPPYPGPKGQAIFEQVSKQAWTEWLSRQTMLINEKRLNMMDKESRDYLALQLEKFMDNEEGDAVEGYVPPSEKS